MKKTSIFLYVLLLLTLTMGCSSDDSMENNDSNLIGKLSPIEEGEDFAKISAFFNAVLPANYGEMEKSPFFDNPQKSVCYIINKKEELESLYHGTQTLPEIDFNNHTLIIGLEKMPHLLYKIKKQEILSNEGGLQLNLYVSVPKESSYPAAIMDMHYWGLYPKFQAKEITVKTIEEE